MTRTNTRAGAGHPRAPQHPGYDPEDVRRELLYLRKGVGYTDARFQACPALIQILGGAHEPVELLRERVESAIHSLHDADADLLWRVFGFDADGRTLAARRDAVGRALGLSREAIADRDAQAVERLLHQLVTGWYPTSPIGIRIPESHNGIVQHHVHVATVVNNRKHELTHHRYRFMATFDGAEYLAVAGDHEALVSVTTGDFTVRLRPAARGTLYQFWHAEPLRRGKVYDLGFIVRNPDVANDPYWLTEESLAFHEPTRLATFEVQFKGDVPASIWHFRGLTASERPGKPTDQNRLTPGGVSRDESTPTRSETKRSRSGRAAIPTFRPNQAATQLSDLYGGLYAGVAWSWPATPPSR